MSRENPANVEVELRSGKECIREVSEGKEYLSGMWHELLVPQMEESTTNLGFLLAEWTIFILPTAT